MSATFLIICLIISHNYALVVNDISNVKIVFNIFIAQTFNVLDFNLAEKLCTHTLSSLQLAESNTRTRGFAKQFFTILGPFCPITSDIDQVLFLLYSSMIWKTYKHSLGTI